MSDLIPPIYCRRCKSQIANTHDFCGVCGWDQSKSFALSEIKAQEEEAAQRQADWQVEQASNRALAQEQKAERAEADREAIYSRATGRGICPHCKSANVVPYTFTEGGSGAGQGMSCCLGCFVSPLAWLALPFLQGKKKRGMECRYCSNRWRL